MAYRQLKPPKHLANRTTQKTTTPSGVIMINGSTFDYAIPCYYREIRKPVPARPHSRPYHDYYGWPTPDHPDSSCQERDFARHGHQIPTPRYGHSSFRSPYDNEVCQPCGDFLDMSKNKPIHLLKEGYEEASVSFVTPPEGLSATAWIDTSRDWIVRIKFIAYCENAILDPVKTKFAVRLKRPDNDRTDIVQLGMLTVLPAALD